MQCIVEIVAVILLTAPVSLFGAFMGLLAIRKPIFKHANFASDVLYGAAYYFVTCAVVYWALNYFQPDNAAIACAIAAAAWFGQAFANTFSRSI